MQCQQRLEEGIESSRVIDSRHWMLGTEFELSARELLLLTAELPLQPSILYFGASQEARLIHGHASAILLSPPPHLWDYRRASPFLSFLYGSWGPN